MWWYSIYSRRIIKYMFGIITFYKGNKCHYDILARPIKLALVPIIIIYYRVKML